MVLAHLMHVSCIQTVNNVTNDKVQIIDTSNDGGKYLIHPVSGDKNESPFHYQISSWIYQKILKK